MVCFTLFCACVPVRVLDEDRNPVKGVELWGCMELEWARMIAKGDFQRQWGRGTSKQAGKRKVLEPKLDIWEIGKLEVFQVMPLPTDFLSALLFPVASLWVLGSLAGAGFSMLSLTEVPAIWLSWERTPRLLFSCQSGLGPCRDKANGEGQERREAMLWFARIHISRDYPETSGWLSACCHFHGWV